MGENEIESKMGEIGREVRGWRWREGERNIEGDK